MEEGTRISSMEVPRKLVQVAIAVVFDGAGKLLICRRKEGTVLGGYWEFPGGKVDAGEMPADCAVREVAEETGLRVAVVRGLEVIEHEYAHAHVRLHPFVCRWEGGALELREVAEAKWIEPDKVTGYRFPEANAGLLREIGAGGIQLSGG